MKNKKSAIIAVAVLLVLVIGAITAWLLLRPTAAAPDGQIQIAVEVRHGDGSTRTLQIATDEVFLRGALEQENLIQGDESEYGLYVKTVDGETADDAQQQWWCITRGGVMLDTGVDSTPIADGEHYEITLTTGW